MNKQILINKTGVNIGISESVFVKECNINDIDNILELQRIVMSDIHNNEIFELTSREEFIFYFESSSIIFGCFRKEKLIAYAISIIPGEDESNLGYDIELEKDELSKVMHFDTVVVHPKFRGNGLQKSLCNMVENEANLMSMEYICTTVSPLNKYSLNNFVNLGYKVILEKVKYDNKNRFILCKRLK